VADPVKFKQRNIDVRLSTIGFYYDFTRFFSALNGQTTPTGKIVRVDNYATHLSGYLFENARGMHPVFLPAAVRAEKINVSIPDETLDWIGQYLITSGVSNKIARKISHKYVAYFLEEFRKNRPNAVIISGDTRMQARAAAQACRELGIRQFFFEQGPFGTTILDTNGVNCTASFAKCFATSRMHDQIDLTSSDCFAPPKARFAERKVVRALDYFIQPVFLLLGFREIREEKKIARQIYRQFLMLKKHNSAIKSPKKTHCPFVLVIGQVPSDANFSIHSSYTTSLQLIRDIEEMFPNMNILFREHPLFIGSYGADFYTHFSVNPRLELSRGRQLDAEIKAAKHIIVVNSTVGMEVVLKYRKPLLCLGDASYAHLNGVYSRERVDDYRATDGYIKDADHQANCLWFHGSFIPGHFRDRDLRPLATQILRKIDED